MRNFIGLIFILSIALSFNGCVSRLFSVGEEKSYCEEHGCDYTDAGVCANPINILKNKDDLSEIIKKNKEARDAESLF